MVARAEDLSSERVPKDLIWSLGTSGAAEEIFTYLLPFLAHLVVSSNDFKFQCASETVQSHVLKPLFNTQRQQLIFRSHTLRPA